MKILSGHGKYDGLMDRECISLCDALNSIEGVRTYESCCGHGKDNFEIFMKITDWDALFFINRCIDCRYFQHNWTMRTIIGDRPLSYKATTFWLSSESRGERAYQEAMDLVDNMNYHLNHKVFMTAYKLKYNRFKYVEYIERKL